MGKFSRRKKAAICLVKRQNPGFTAYNKPYPCNRLFRDQSAKIRICFASSAFLIINSRPPEGAGIYRLLYERLYVSCGRLNTGCFAATILPKMTCRTKVRTKEVIDDGRIGFR